MNNLKIGFGRVNVNPPMGIRIAGYYKTRLAEGVLDDLEINAMAVSDGKTTAAVIAVDHCGIKQKVIAELKASVVKATGLDEDAVYISATHTHTGPYLELDSESELEREYYTFFSRRIADVAQFALDDLKPAKMGWGIGEAPNIAFVRRFRMKDGSVKTNPGVDNPDIVAPIGDVDERVSVLRFDREGAETIVFVNFANHPDVVGGNLISADWCGLLRKDVEKILDNTKCIFVNGMQGDVNHVNVHPTGGFLNGMFMDFDDVARGYAHAEYLARVVTGGVLQAYDKVKYVNVDSVGFVKRVINVPANLPKPEDMPKAKEINDLHNAGRDDEIPFKGMMLTTVVAEAARMVRLENGPESFEMNLSGIRIGDVALIGLPGEPFTGIGRAFKATDDWELVIPTCLTNGSEGYFPMQDAYDEGGYEARSSSFKAGVAEYLIEEGKTLLNSLKNKK